MTPSQPDPSSGVMENIRGDRLYVRREHQSPDYLAVPAAALEEARDAVPGGDGRSLIEHLLTHADVLTSEHMTGDDGAGSSPPSATDRPASRWRRLSTGWGRVR